MQLNSSYSTPAALTRMHDDSGMVIVFRGDDNERWLRKESLVSSITQMTESESSCGERLFPIKHNMLERSKKPAQRMQDRRAQRANNDRASHELRGTQGI